MSLQATVNVIPLEQGYDYTSLQRELAQTVRAAASRIRERMKRTLENIVAMGADLLKVEAALPYGQLGRWLLGEFAWSHRTAHNLMTVASWLGAGLAIISKPQMAPAAAYLLAAPSTPESARQEALERARAGERITPQVARDIIEWARREERCEGGCLPGYRLRPRLARILERYRQRWQHSDLSELADQLHDFAAGLLASKPATKQEREQEMA